MNYVGGTAEQWWKLEKRFGGAMRRVSDDLDPDGRHALKLGSPVLVGTEKGDIVRVPVILLGGPRELPMAYLYVRDLRVNARRVDAIADRTAALAREAIAGVATSAGKDVVIEYP